jgi:putative endonuclease
VQAGIMITYAVIPAKAGIQHRMIELFMTKSYVYILAGQRNGTLYVGVTSDLIKRVYEHKQNLIDGFTKKYSVHVLVYYEIHRAIEEAIAREKQIKKWNRQWKLRLIEEGNPEWKDLYDEIIQ